MIVINMHGMLGNQLFQYAYARQLSKERGASVVLNTAFLPVDGYRLECIGFQIDHRRYKYNLAYFLYLVHTKFKSKSGRWINVYFETSRKRKPLPERLPKMCYLDGYWQGVPYVNLVLDEMREEFHRKMITICSDKCSVLAKRMKAEPCSVMLHVRRGDYLATAGAIELYSQIPLVYYEKAIDHIKSQIGKVSVYIFTNDKEWVRSNLTFLRDFEIVDCDRYDYETLMLMSSCNHFVIANSTLSWWAAQLCMNDKKIVCAPSKWFNNESCDPHDLYPEEWVKL